MAYEVTATRKRPQDFDHLVGQEFVVSTLKNAIKSARIAHAYLFAGPRGVGKTSAARILAKALNCPEGLDANACFDWAGAEDIAKGRSIDVIEIDGASNTSVNDIRAIKDEVLFPPQGSRYKIYIIDEVHMLSNSAFNALLKTIEEPPPYIIFIFATTELHKVPATIRSRCQQFMFRLIPLETIRDRLTEAAADLAVKADDEALYWIAKESTGSMRDAYTLLDQIVSFSEGHIKLERIREKLGLVGLEQINSMVAHCLNSDTAAALQLFHEILGSGVSVEQFVIDLAEYYRGLLFIQSGVQREAILGYARERFLEEAVQTYTRSQLEKVLSMLLQTYRDLRYSIDARYELEVTISRICRIKSYVEPGELYEKMRKLETEMRTTTLTTPKAEANHQQLATPGGETAATATKAKPATSTKVSEPAPSADPVASKESNIALPTQISELDPDHIAALSNVLRKQKLSLSPLLDQVCNWQLTGDTLVLILDKRYPADSLRAEQQLIIQACHDILPSVRLVDIRVVEKASTDSGETPVDARVEKIREVFRGEIVDQGGLV